MEWAEDYTPMFMDIAKDAKGREAIEYGYETEEEYKDHLIRVIFDYKEQDSMNRLLLELMEAFDMYIGNDEMTTLENANVPRAIEISKSFVKRNAKTEKAFEKFMTQLENAVRYQSDVFFG